MLKHSILKNPYLHGFEYGTLRSFENSIASVTNADKVDLPINRNIEFINNKFPFATWKKSFREFITKTDFEIEGDVIWHVLMGPENYYLDILKLRKRSRQYRILYFFDTLPNQFSLIKHINVIDKWDLLITSFNDAVPSLEKITKRKWHCIEQGVPTDAFQDIEFEKKVIPFSAYGRTSEYLINMISEFCLINNLYFDKSFCLKPSLKISSEELYSNYIWHLSHSLFTLSLPVELTNPTRAGHLNPITCRWYEALAACTVPIGMPPNNEMFKNYFPDDFVQELNPNWSKERIFETLENLLINSHIHYIKARRLKEHLLNSISWENRANRILKLIELETTK